MQVTNTAATLKPVIMQGTAFSRMEWKSINCMKKFVQIQTDIIFLSKCKQMDIVPKGLKVKNPLQSTYHTDYADSLCHTLSKKLRNHLINILYSKQGKIKNELSKMDTLIKNQPSTQTSSWLDFTKTRQAIYNAHFASLQKKKDTKLSKLLHATRGHSNGSLNPPSNIVNLSNYTLSPAEAAVLSRGLSFCPSTPTNMIQFCGDLESYFRRLRLKEYFQNTSEQHTNPQRSPYQHYRKRDSRWTPPEGRNSRLDFYIECFRRRARAEIVEKQHHLPHNLSHAERNAIHSLRNNSDIIIKKADKGGAVVVMNRSEYEQEAARQLSNTSFYKPLPSDPTENLESERNGILLCDWDCVYNEVVSLLAHMDDQDKGKIALRIAFIAETKLASVLTVLLEKLQKDEQNRIDIYYVLEKLLQQDTQGLERRLLKKIITLASNHMTETQEARNEVKVAASNTLVTLARCYFSDVMLELVYHLELPEEFIFMTLGNLSSAYALKCIPFVGMILKAMISMLALVKDNRMRQAFCGVLEKCSRAVNVYFMNWEKCPFPRMGESQFCKNILPLYSHVTSNWLSCEELELKKAVIKALGPMMGILLHKKEPQNPIFKEISWLLEQYKEEIDVFHVTKSLSQLLEVSGEYKIPLPKAKFQAICRALHNQ
ncbi:unnamed protein product, partial [Lepidochelys olivacea]